MELVLALHTDSQVKVTCDSDESHTFNFKTVFPDENNSDAPPHPMQDPKTYGQAVFESLFPEGSRARENYDGLMMGDRLLLVASEDVVQAIPFEYAHDGDDFIVKDYVFVRGLPENKRKKAPDIDSGLHIVTVPSEPLAKNVQPLNIDGEWSRLRQIVENITDRAIMLERVRPPTVEQLGSLVTGKQNRVIHFMGHGANTPIGSGLVFEDETGGPNLATARDFMRRVRGSAFMVTLNACVSAAPGATDLDNIAAALVGNGVPYALGMRFVIVDTDALAFSRTFYDQLARGVSAEEAVMQARIALADKSRRDWAVGVPVLYTSLDGAASGFQQVEGQPIIEEHQPSIDVLAIPRAEGVFQGRAEELKMLGSLLTGDNRSRIVTIHGGGGQGKTALAREAVERFAWDSPGGVYAATLEELPERTTFINNLARFLGLDISQTTDAELIEKAVVQVLGMRRTLLVLDNAETLVEAIRADNGEARKLANFFRETLNGTRTQLLLTSRELTGWSGERVLALLGLSDEDGAELFRDNAPQRRPDILMGKARELSKTVGGHPLSLRLLGSAFNEVTQPFEGFIADYETVLRESKDIYKEEDHRHHSLYAAIETSVRHLNDDLKDLLSGLWVFHAPFLAETAADIFDHDGEYEEGEKSPIYNQLQILFRRSLLAQETHSMLEGTFRFYRLLPGVRLYAEEMDQVQDKDSLLARFGASCARLAELLKGQRGRGTLTARWLPLLAPDLQRGLAYVEAEGQAGYLNDMGLVYDALGDKQQALSYYERALPLSQQVGDKSGEATTLNNIGGVYDALGDKQQALSYYEQALVIFREIRDPMFEAGQLTNIGLLLYELNRQVEGVEHLKQAIGVLEKYHLPFAAGGTSKEQLQEWLAQMESGGTQSGGTSTLSPETRRMLVVNTVAVMTTVKEKVDEWRQAMAESLANVEQEGESWQIEVEYYTAILAILDSEASELPESNPYQEDVEQILAGIQAGGLPSTPSTMPAETRQLLIENTVAVMTTAKEKHDEWRETIQGALAKIEQEGEAWQIEVDYHKAILSILDGKEVELPEGNPYQEDVEQILAGIQAGDLPEVASDEDDDENEGQEMAQQVMGAVSDYLDAGGLDEMQQVVEEKHELLFSEVADAVFEIIVGQAQQSGNQQVVQGLQGAQALLRACKTDGIEATFRRMRDLDNQ